MNCPNCGVKLASISKFCPECGAKLTVQEEKKNKKAPDSIEELLVNIVQNYGGPELYKESNARKLAGLLKDFAGSNFQDEVKLLSRIVPEGVQEVLYNSNNSSPEEKQGALTACKLKLVEDLFLAEEKAIETTNILATGLGWEIKTGESTRPASAATVAEVKKDLYEDDYLENQPLKDLLDIENKTHNPQVQNWIGLFYDETTKYGKDVSKDNKKAVYWYQKSADQGYARAQLDLGTMYAHGTGVQENYQKAIEWYSKAADQGYAKAQNNMGLMFETGKGVSKDYQKAVEWYQKAANQGSAVAQCNLGFMYEKGKGVIKNLCRAIEWYQKAAEQGSARAQYNLGYLYDKYEYAEEWGSSQKAVEWYKKAADQGHSKAQYKLGELYRCGHGVSRDYYKAV